MEAILKSGPFVIVPLALSLVACLTLSGCVAMNAVSQVSAAAVQSMSAVGRAAVGTANVVNRTVREIPAALMYGPGSRRVVIPMNGPRRTVRQTSTRPARARPANTRTAARPRPAPIRTQRQQTAKEPEQPARTARADEFLEVMPPDMLDRLSQDEMNLQGIVQTEALESEVGETVFWELGERAGTSMAEPEHRMGAFTCRIMVESLKIDGAATESRATACRTENAPWMLSF